MNVGKIKVMWCNREGIRGINMSLYGKILKKIKCFKNLGIDMASNEGMEC